MAFEAFKYTPYAESLWSQAGIRNARAIRAYGEEPQIQGLQNLLKMLQQEGRVDPRLLAALQAQNSRSTQQQQDQARAGAARNGLGGGGLNQALQAAIGAAGQNRSMNLTYQDIADSYKRNQENLGLLNQGVTQPSLGYANLGVQYGIGQQEQENKQKSAWLGFAGSLLGGAGKAFGGGGGG